MEGLGRGWGGESGAVGEAERGGRVETWMVGEEKGVTEKAGRLLGEPVGRDGEVKGAAGEEKGSVKRAERLAGKDEALGRQEAPRDVVGAPARGTTGRRGAIIPRGGW